MPNLSMVLVAALFLAGNATLSEEAEINAFPVDIRVDASQPGPELEPIWRFFGADEPNCATLKDGEKLFESLGELAPGKVYFRAHDLLTTGDGRPALKWCSTNAYTEDESANPVYGWSIVDRVFDSYLEHGVRPLVKIGFMGRNRLHATGAVDPQTNLPLGLAVRFRLHGAGWRLGLPAGGLSEG